jgi:hypothetical protein
MIRIQALLQQPCRHAQRPAAQGRLDRLQVQFLNGAGAEQSLDLLLYLGDQPLRQRRFFYLGGRRAGRLLQPGITNLLVRRRQRASQFAKALVYSAIWARVRSTAGPEGMALLTVLPSTAWVTIHMGPCPRSPGRAQWQLGLPHFRYRSTKEPGRISPS